MLSVLYSGCVQGLRAHLVQVEVDLQPGLPSFCVVGLPDASVRESKERVRSAFKNSDLFFPMKRITVNLAPALLKKEGSAFELAIALALFMADQKWNFENFKHMLFLGELSLQGFINPVRGILPLVLAADKKGIEKIFIPKVNVPEAQVGMVRTEIYGVESLREVIQFLKNEITFIPAARSTPSQKNTIEYGDFSEVKGQTWSKKALEIASAGAHNILMVGPPGCGKSMLAQRFPSILPPLSFKESLEVTQIYSVSGLLKENECWINENPFRNPHHTISYPGLIGGGQRSIMPGEVTLAHRGVLFLDELPEFRRDALEALREPLEEGKISICRTGGRFIYPARFLFIGAMNPCPCGYYGHAQKECICNESQVQRYKAKVSGPLLDRIDIHVSVSAVSMSDLNKLSNDKISEESSMHVLDRVIKARQRQKERFKHYSFLTNSQLTPKAIAELCTVTPEAQKKLHQVMEKFGLSYRTYHKILKISQTIADLEGENHIHIPHIAQALQLRFLDR